MDSEAERYIKNIDFLIESLYNTQYTRSRIIWKNILVSYKCKQLYSTVEYAKESLAFYLRKLNDKETACWQNYKEEEAKIPKTILEKRLRVKKNN